MILDFITFLIVGITAIVILGGVAYSLTPLLNPEQFNYLLYTRHERYVHIDYLQSTADSICLVCDDHIRLIKIPVSPIWYIRPLRPFVKKPEYPQDIIAFENELCKKIWNERKEYKGDKK